MFDNIATQQSTIVLSGKMTFDWHRTVDLFARLALFAPATHEVAPPDFSSCPGNH
jgi:hypothetical protein